MTDRANTATGPRLPTPLLPNFYLEYGAVTLAGLATATLIARLFDAVTDPLIGYLSDRSGTRKPARRISSCGTSR